MKSQKLYFHNTDAEFDEFIDRPTFFSLTLEENLKYMINFPGSTTLIVESVVDLKIASINLGDEFRRQVWDDSSEFLYSMFDKRVGEYEVEEIDRFIKLFKDRGFDAALLSDYSPDHESDTVTMVVFEPSKKMKIKYQVKSK